MAAAETARLIAELSLRDKLTPGINKALGSVGRLETGMSRVGRGAGQLSTGIARAGTIIAGAAVTGLGAAAKAAIDWQDAFQGVVKTVDEADLKSAGLTFRDLELSLREMSTQMPNTAQELAGIAEAAGAMGIKGKDIEAFTKQVAILASTTDVSANDAAIALGQMVNVIGLSADEFDNFAASLVDLGNKGVSFESAILEIARRSGGAAKLFGIAKKETLGWAAAAANLGLNEELAGTALQKMFLTLLPKYSKGAKDLQQITGKTGDQLKKSFQKDAGGAVEDLIKTLSKLPKAARADAIVNLFGKGTGITRLVNGLADSYTKNLIPSLRGGTKAWDEAIAAQEEFDKRNATVRSSIARLKNGLIDAAVTVGEGFAPALGRASDKLATFLREDVNRDALKRLGEDIGKSIDEIDWQSVLKGAREFTDIMRSAFDWAKRIYDVFNALPNEIKGSLAGLLAVNKLSGGLIGGGLGNIVGGLGETAARGLGSKVPGIGKLFAQPVFVTNWPPGGFGGPGGPADPIRSIFDTLKPLLAPLLAVAAVGAVGAALQGQTDQQGDALLAQTKGFAGKATDADLANAIKGVTEQLDSQQFNTFDQKNKIAAVLNTLVAEQNRRTNDRNGGNIQARTSDAKIAGIFARSLAKFGRSPTEKQVLATLHRNVDRTEKVIQINRETKAKAQATAAAVKDADASIRSGADRTAAASRDAGRHTATALKHLPAPTTNVRVNVNVSGASVQKSYTVSTRYGPVNSSHGSAGLQALTG